jgi:hypothetical protein
VISFSNWDPPTEEAKKENEELQARKERREM